MDLPIDCTIDCRKTPICYECNYRYPNYHNAFNDPNLSLAAKLLWVVISERKEGFDASEYLDGISKEDLIFEPLMELLNRGYFNGTRLE